MLFRVRFCDIYRRSIADAVHVKPRAGPCSVSLPRFSLVTLSASSTAVRPPFLLRRDAQQAGPGRGEEA